MAPDVSIRRYRSCYAALLRLYPRPFRERFGEGMAQAFHDLYREHSSTSRGLFRFTLWIFSETLLAIVKENLSRMNQLGSTILRVALVALGLLMVPLVASQLIEDWHWGIGGFVFAYLMFFVTGLAYALIARRISAPAYKAAVALALAAGFGLGWSNMVHVADSENPANLFYFTVLAVGAVGACLARLQPRGLARTLFAMATTLALIATLLPSGAPPYMARNMAIGHVVFVALFAVSGLLFRQAGLASTK